MFSKLWRDPVWSKVIASGIVAGIVVAWTSFEGLWPVVGQFLASCWAWLGQSSSLHNWLVVLLGLCALAVTAFLGVLGWAAVADGSDAPSSRVGWRAYIEDEFLGLKWRWDYSSDGQITRLVPFCARCDYQIRPLVHGGFYETNTTTYLCEDCGHRVGLFQGTPSGVESQVERKIQKRLRNGTWSSSDSAQALQPDAPERGAERGS